MQLTIEHQHGGSVRRVGRAAHHHRCARLNQAHELERTTGQLLGEVIDERDGHVVGHHTVEVNIPRVLAVTGDDFLVAITMMSAQRRATEEGIRGERGTHDKREQQSDTHFFPGSEEGARQNA